MRRIAVLLAVFWTFMSTPLAHAAAQVPRRPSAPRLARVMARAVHRSPVIRHRTRSERVLPAGQARTFAFRARRSGHVGAIALRLGSRATATRVLVALFTSHRGRPGALLAAGSISGPRAGAWNAIAVPTTRVDSGRRYWVALLGRGGGVSLVAGATSCTARTLASRRRLAVTWSSAAAWGACAPLATLTPGHAPGTGTGSPAGGSGSGSPAAPTAPIGSPASATGPLPPTTTTEPVTTTVTTSDPAPPTTPAPPAAPACDLTATPANFAAQVSQAQAGATVCLAGGDYGTWTGAGKPLTVEAAAGASPTMTVDFAGHADGVTLDGIGGLGGEIDQGAENVTIEGSAFTSALVLDDLTNAGIVLDADTFDDINDNANCTDEPARIHLDYYSTTSSGVTVENSVFDGGDTDGIQTGAPLTIEHNVFEDITENGPDDCQHTDSIQGVGATGVVVVGNLFDNDSDGFVDFDDSSDDTVTDNACYAIGRGACVTLYGDSDSVVEHNTAGPGMNALEIDTKPGNPAGAGTIFEDNVGGFSAEDGSKLGADSGNLFAGAASPNVAGTPRFAGGAAPTTWAGFELASTSAGYLPAGEGAEAGIRAGVGGPPAQ